MKNILLILLSISFISLRSAEIPYPFSAYNYTYLTNDAGLPHNFVDDIVKDSQGYIWFATHNGLSRYDGYKFLTFTTTTNPIALKSNYVNKVCEDNFNRLWIASEGGIDIIDMNKYCNIDIKTRHSDVLEDMFSSNVRSIYKDRKGDMWISSDNTLYCLEFDENGQILEYYSLEKGVCERPVLAISDLGWAICAGINNSLVRIDKRKENILKISPVSKLVDAYFEDWVIHCMQLDGELLWIGTNRGLFCYDHFNQEIKRYGASSKRKEGAISQSHITDIKLDESGNLFIATLKGLNIYNRDSDNFSFIESDDENIGMTLNCNFVNCLMSDENCLWVGTEIGGVNLLTRGRLTTRIWKHSRRTESSISANAVNAICEDRQGNLWVGTVEGGLNLKRKGKDTFEHFVSESKDKTTISHNSVSGLLLDKENQLWVYTWGGSINRLDLNVANNRKFKRYKPKAESVELNFVSSACEDTINNGIWFGTTEGLHFYDKKTDAFQKVKFNHPNNRFETMNSLLIDRKNKLWVGTSEGLFIIDLFSFARSRIHFDYNHIKHKLSNPSYLVADKINCIIEDSEGIIWIGTNGNGLYKMIANSKDEYKFENYKIENGLPDNNIIGIVEDGLGSLWLSSDKGVALLDKKNMVFSNFTKYDGLLTNQFYWNAYLYSITEDMVYFGNTLGLVAIKPNLARNYNYETIKVSLTGLSVLGENIYPGDDGYISQSISSSTELHFHESDRAIKVDFSAKKYDYITQIRYAYRLKGHDDEWTETKVGENSATYTSLPSGSYVFQVRATNNQGYWSDDITEIAFNVRPYFYKSWWFISIVLLLLGIMTYWFYKRKTRQYREQQIKLEKIVKERTSEIASQNLKLIEVSRKLAHSTEEKISFFTHLVHEFRTPVTLIHGPLEKAIQQTEKSDVKENLIIAERNSKYLLTLVNELMDFRKLDSDFVKLDIGCQNIQEFFEYILMPFYAYARERKIEFRTFYRLSNPYVCLDYSYIRKVIVNLVSNAIKATPHKGKVCVYVAELNSEDQDKQLYICVRDTGIGIPEDDIEKVFDQFYQSKNKNKHAELWQNSTGVGLYSCEKIIKLHGGDIKARNNQGGGVSLRVLVPYVAGQPIEAEVGENDILPQVTSDTQAPISSKETILVVDDNPDMRSYIKSLLQAHYRIREAQDGAEALSIIQTQKIDLVLSDLMMPVMDGIELSRQVKQNISISHIPFLILTAVASEEHKKISYQIGVDAYLSKPFDEEMLLLRIQNILNTRKKYKAQFSLTMNTDDLGIEPESRDQKFVKTALSLMSTNYGKSDYDLDSFVKDMGYSKTLVNKKMQDLTGQSIGQFMRNYRLNMAQEILTNSADKEQINISEVAYKVGFNDPKYFTRCFKEYTGVLPSTLLSNK